jgi:hypothetical protein
MKSTRCRSGSGLSMYLSTLAKVYEEGDRCYCHTSNVCLYLPRSRGEGNNVASKALSKRPFPTAAPKMPRCSSSRTATLPDWKLFASERSQAHDDDIVREVSSGLGLELKGYGKPFGRRRCIAGVRTIGWEYGRRLIKLCGGGVTSRN